MEKQTKPQPAKKEDDPPDDERSENEPEETRPERSESPWKHLPRPTRR
jgi:hypothetical protein